MKVALSILAVVSFAVVANCGTPTISGPCPDFKPQENVELAKTAGEWYELGYGKVGIEVDKAKADKTFKCVKKSITPTANGYDSTVSFIDGDNKNVTKSVKGTKLEGPKAKFTVSGDEMKVKEGITATLSIIDTDYTNIMLGSVCITDGTKHGYKFAAFGREKSYPPAEIDSIKEVLKKHGITAELTLVDQSC